MSVNRRIEESLARLTFEHREEQYRHHTYDEDLYQYELLRNGDARAVGIGKQLFEGAMTGPLSDDPVTNYRYLFVASITLACRFCIEGGMAAEEAFNMSAEDLDFGEPLDDLADSLEDDLGETVLDDDELEDFSPDDLADLKLDDDDL